MRRSALLWFCLIAALVPADAQDIPDPNAAVRLALQAELEDFSRADWNRKPAEWKSDGVFAPAVGPALNEYRRRMIATADWEGRVWHQAGTLPWSTRQGKAEKLAVNVFFPQGPSKGTLLFVHGYLSHTANFAYTFAFFTARGWTVVTLDLPGHGMSTGARGDIGAFEEYGDAVALWMDWVRRQDWPGQSLLLAHSLGSAACFEALSRGTTPRPDRVVFCAPLLRPVWYGAAALGDAIAGWAFRYFPSQFGWDRYLDGYVMPVHWFQALERWLDGLDRRRPLKLPLTVYAGENDTTVDTAWNAAEYRRLVPGVKVVLLSGQAHMFISNKKSRAAFHERLAADLGL